MRVASASACARGPGLRSHGRRRLRRCSVLPSNKQEAAAFTPDAALELLLSQPATGTLLTLVLEWATQEALQARAKGHPTSNLTQHLYAHLGCALRSHSLWVFSRLTCTRVSLARRCLTHSVVFQHSCCARCAIPTRRWIIDSWWKLLSDCCAPALRGDVWL